MNPLKLLLDPRLSVVFGTLAVLCIIYVVWKSLFSFIGCKRCQTYKLENGMAVTRLVVTGNMDGLTLYGMLKNRGFRILTPEESKIAAQNQKVIGYQWDFVISRKDSKFFRLMLRSHIENPYSHPGDENIQDAIVFVTKDVVIPAPIEENRAIEAA